MDASFSSQFENKNQAEEKFRGLSKAEQQLRQSEENFSKVFRSSPVALMITRITDGQYIELNESYTKLVGYERAELLGHLTTEFNIYIYPEQSNEILNKLRTHGALYNYEATIQNKAGELHVVLASLELIQFNGEACILTTMLDITERKQVETELKEVRELFQKIFDLSPIATALSKLSDRVVVDINAATEKLLGYSRAEMIGRPGTEFDYWQEVDERQRAYELLLTQGRLQNFEFTFKSKDGQTGQAMIFIEVIELNHEKYFLTNFINITERKQAELRLQQSEESFSKAFSSSPTALMITRLADGRYMELNEAYTKIIGYERDELLGHLTTEFNIYIYPEQRIEILNQLRAHGSLYNYEATIQNKSGELRTVLASLELIQFNGEACILTTMLDITERKQAEDALRESEARFSKIFHVSPIGINIFGLVDGHSMDVNEAFLQIVGYSRAEVIGHSADELKLFVDEQVRDTWFMNLRQNKVIRNQNTRIRRKSGEIRDVLASIDVIDITGQRMALVVALDVTEMRQAEEHIRYQANLLENVSDAIIATDLDSRITRWNLAAEDIYGWHANEVIGKPINDFLHTEYPKGISGTQIFQKFLEEKTWKGEVTQTRKDGKKIAVLASVSLVADDTSGAPTAMVALNRDITERKHREEQLRQSEQKFSTLFEKSALTVSLSKLPDGILVDVNETFEEVFGFIRQEVIGKTTSELGINPDEESRARILKAIKEHGMAHNLEMELRIKSGEMRFFLVNIDFVEIDDQQYILNSTQDITDRKRAEESLRTLNIQLEQRVAARTAELTHANRAKDEFLASMSHELRTPLNTVLGLSEVLLEQLRGPLNEAQEHALQLISSSGQHLLGLINDILEVSKIEAGKLQIHPDVISVKEVCESSINFVKELALKKSITLDYWNNSEIAKVYADPQRLKQILVNLLNNAVKFTPEHGNVSLEVEVNAERDQIQFIISDTGIGIAPEDLYKLFTPFTQLDSSLTRQYAGTGLGLVLVLKFTELHGGSVQVESEVGKGSRFTVVLPWAESLSYSPDTNTDRTAEPATELESSTPELGLVLLADDNEANIMLLDDYLQDHGFEVALARTGLEALDQAEKCSPNLILMDIQMPEMDGLEAIRQLRAKPRFRSTPIIALTALAMRGDRERCLEAGADDYMSKPIRLKELIKTITNLMERKRQSPN